ncbi:hypothetical protein FRB98_006415 [Tulasnella sp. 332]|nr:hypothetical protein FRB98_006415 [Tulasnella sp. 332]
MSTTMSSTKSKHFLLTTIIALGHIRAESGIVCELVKLDPHLTFTVLLPKTVAPLFTQELAQWSITDGDLARIRVIGTGKSGKPAPGKTFEWMLEVIEAQGAELREAYQTIIGRGSLTCTTTGTVFDFQHIPTPSAVFCDMFTPELAPYVKQTTPDVKIINLWVTTAGSLLWHHGKTEHGGMAEWDAQTKAILEKGEGKTYEEIAESIRRQPHTGKLLPSPDGVKMYDYEAGPPGGGPLPVKLQMGAMLQATQIADASITATTHDYEPAAGKVLKDWYEGELGKKLFNFGPLVPFSAAPYKAPSAAARTPFKPVFDFLDSHPPKSVMLVSFGSVFFPSQPWQLETIFKTLLETRTPFITSRAPALYQPIHAGLEKTIQESGLGLIVDYVPQRDILTHPSLGSFLSHGGNNSMFESIAAGVLNVFWPFAADQPIHAAYMTQVRDCSWELLQIRVGEGLKPPAQGGKIEGTPAAIASEFKQVLSEIKGDSVAEGHLAHIRVVGTGKSGKPEPGKSLQWLFKILLGEVPGLCEAYQSIAEGGSLTCTAAGTVVNFQDVAAPSAVFCDIFTPALAPYVKQTTPDITTAGAILAHYRRKEVGWKGDWDVQAKAVLKKEDRGRTFDEVVGSILTEPSTGRMIQNVDGLKRYNYELKPQGGGGAALPVSMILASKESSMVLQNWHKGELGKKIFGFGPLLPISAAPYKAPSATAQTPFKIVFGFLDSHPPECVMLGHPDVSKLGLVLPQGGNNSMFESIAAGILNVFWPFDADQPLHAAYMAEVIRLGEGAQPPAGRGEIGSTAEAVTAEFKQVHSEIKGDVGERKRKNLMILRQKTFNALKEGGEVEKNAHSCLEFLSREA